MRYLVTGGAGFIGSHLVERLLASGAAVTVLDDLSSGRRENLAAVADSPRLGLHVGSVLDAELVDALAAGAGAIVHLAAAVGVRRVVERPDECFAVNVEGSRNVVRAAARHRRKLLIASSSEVYGRSPDVPFREDRALPPLLEEQTRCSRWSYARAKAIGEQLALDAARRDGLPVVVVRFFNTVGARQHGRYGMVLPTFVGQALAGRPLTIHGTGRQSRCFGDVHDVVEAVVRLLSSDAAHGRVFNVGSDRETSVRALAELVRARTASHSPMVFVPYDDAFSAGFEDVPRRVPDLGRLRATTGFVARIPLERTIDDVVAAYKRSAAGLVG